jgi:type IV secretion system protein VirB10
MSVMDQLRLEKPVPEEEALAVALPDQRWVLPLGLGGAALLGLVVFWQMSAARSQPEEMPSPSYPPGLDLGAAIDANPPLETYELPAEPIMEEPLEFPVQPAPPAEDPSTALETRAQSPALVIDLSQADVRGTASNGPFPTIAEMGRANGDRNYSPGDQPAPQPSQSSARAEILDNPAYTVVEGSIIPAILETAINSDLPGYVRATVSRDVLGFDGTNVLIPRGSRLVGQYRASAVGQSRAFVVWTRVIRPDGVSVSLSAPGADTLGRGGLEGEVDRHFVRRFGGAILLSLINVGSVLAGNDNQTQVVIGSTTGAANGAASLALQSDLNISPTVEVNQGTPVHVFVTGDLDFSVLSEAE